MNFILYFLFDGFLKFATAFLILCMSGTVTICFIFIHFRVYPYLCRAVRNFAQDRGQVPPAKEFYVSFTDVHTRLK